jgi:hypothetical protein
MFGRRNRQITDEQLDRLGRALVMRATDNEAAAEVAASAPFLYARVRARIAAAEQASASEADEGWLALLAISRRAVPALSAVAAFVFALMLWLASSSAPAANGFGDEAFYGSEAGVERTVLASTDNLSRDEVLSIVVDREEQGRR